MEIPNSLTKFRQSLKTNAPAIFTGASAAGVVATAYLTARSTFVAARIIDHEERVGGTVEDPKERLKERTKLVWRVYIPPALAGTATVTCIFAGAKIQSNRTAAAVTAYSVLQRGFDLYSEKIIEEIGENKEQKIRDETAQEEVARTHPAQTVIFESGEVMCCELYTQRYFKSNMERLKKAQNEINAQINNQYYVTLSEFYDLINLEHTSVSSNLGWDSDKLMELTFSVVLSPNGDPCIAFDYNYVKPL